MIRIRHIVMFGVVILVFGVFTARCDREEDAARGRGKERVISEAENEAMVDRIREKVLNAPQKPSEAVRRAIAEELSVGDSAQAIEAFFQRHNIDYSYDRFAERYHGIIREVGGPLNQSVSIDIYVDGKRRFERAEVYNSFTAP